MLNLKPSFATEPAPQEFLPKRWKIILLSDPGPRRDALLAILRSMPGPQDVLNFSTLDESETQVKTPESALIIIDQAVDGGPLRQAIPIIRQWNSRASILLLAAHPREMFQNSPDRPDSVLCNGFSFTLLIREVERLKLEGGPLCD